MTIEKHEEIKINTAGPSLDAPDQIETKATDMSVEYSPVTPKDDPSTPITAIKMSGLVNVIEDDEEPLRKPEPELASSET